MERGNARAFIRGVGPCVSFGPICNQTRPIRLRSGAGQTGGADLMTQRCPHGNWAHAYPLSASAIGPMPPGIRGNLTVLRIHVDCPIRPEHSNVIASVQTGGGAHLHMNLGTVGQFVQYVNVSGMVMTWDARRRLSGRARGPWTWPGPGVLAPASASSTRGMR